MVTAVGEASPMPLPLGTAVFPSSTSPKATANIFVSADGQCTIFYNREVYNYREIRTVLKRAGERYL